MKYMLNLSTNDIMLAALEGQDYTIIATANKHLADFKKLAREWSIKFTNLYKEHN